MFEIWIFIVLLIYVFIVFFDNVETHDIKLFVVGWRTERRLLSKHLVMFHPHHHLSARTCAILWGHEHRITTLI